MEHKHNSKRHEKLLIIWCKSFEFAQILKLTSKNQKKIQICATFLAFNKNMGFSSF